MVIAGIFRALTCLVPNRNCRISWSQTLRQKRAIDGARLMGSKAVKIVDIRRESSMGTMIKTTSIFNVSLLTQILVHNT